MAKPNVPTKNTAKYLFGLIAEEDCVHNRQQYSKFVIADAVEIGKDSDSNEQSSGDESISASQ